MALTKNEDVYKMQAQLNSIDVSSLTNLADSDRGKLEVLSSRIGGSLDNVSTDNWTDDVKSGVANAASQIQEYISKGITATDFIAGAVGPVSNLQKICNEYVEKYDSYLKEKDRDVRKYETENGTYKLNSSGSRIINNDYLNWKKLLEAYEKTIPLVEADAIRIKQAVINYFSAIDLTTNTLNSSIYTEGSADISADFSSYFNGFLEVTLDEWVGETTTDYSIDDEGHIVERIEGDHTTQYEDGSHIDTHRTEENTYNDINGDGQVDEEDELIYRKVHDEGTFTDADGNVYGYIGDREEDQIGLVRNEVTLTDQESGDEVYHLDEERVAANVTQTEIRENEYNTVETTEETTTETRTIESEGVVTSNVTITTSNSDPACGTLETDDGRIITVYRDGNQLREKVEYVDMQGNTQLYSDYEIEEETNTFTITYPDGHTESMQVNPSSSIDVQRMRNALEDARSQYYVADHFETGPFLDDLFEEGSTEIWDTNNPSDKYMFTLE